MRIYIFNIHVYLVINNILIILFDQIEIQISQFHKNYFTDCSVLTSEIIFAMTKGR